MAPSLLDERRPGLPGLRETTVQKTLEYSNRQEPHLPLESCPLHPGRKRHRLEAARDLDKSLQDHIPLKRTDCYGLHPGAEGHGETTARRAEPNRRKMELCECVKKIEKKRERAREGEREKDGKRERERERERERVREREGEKEREIDR